MQAKYIFRYASDLVVNNVLKLFYKKPKVMSDLDTVKYIVENRCSIARFGDGELRLMRGIDLEFQRCEPILKQKIREVKSTSKCLVCIPSIFDPAIFNTTEIREGAYKYWKKFNCNRGGFWNFYFGKQQPLGDAFISRFYHRKRDKTKVPAYVEELKKLWDKRDIIFVEGEKSRLGVGNDLFDNANSIKRILCPATDCFDKYDQLKEAIFKFAKKDSLIIMAMGPTATIMAYELSENFQCLDLGHIDIEYEWFKMGATQKVPIPHKYVNEADGGRVPDDNVDEKYKSEILITVK